MASFRTDPAHDGCRDCGRFFLDAIGEYAREDVIIQWLPAPDRTCGKLDGQVEEIWSREVEKAAHEQRNLYNGPLCRLLEFQADQKQLLLTLGPTNFKHFLGTNLTQAPMRYVHGPEVLANPLGVAAAVITDDHFLLMGRRSNSVQFYPQRVHPVSGMVEPPADGRFPDPFAAMLHELHGEVGITAEMVAAITCMGLVRDKSIVQPELVFDIKLKVDAQTIREVSSRAADAHEHQELILVLDFPASVIMFIEKNLELLTPVGLSTLLLHGLRKWGSGWFTSARGYLQSVI